MDEALRCLVHPAFASLASDVRAANTALQHAAWLAHAGTSMGCHAYSVVWAQVRARDRRCRMGTVSINGDKEAAWQLLESLYELGAEGT